MDSGLDNDLLISVRAILLDNATFYREGPDDGVFYHIDLHAIGAVAEDILKFIRDFASTATVAGRGHSWAKEQLRKRRERRGDSAGSTVAELTDSKASLIPEPARSIAKERETLDGLNQELGDLLTRVQEQERRIALIEEIAEILSYYGWPLDEASEDAGRILEIVVSREKAKRGDHAV